jgi:hypothetical protein
MRAGSLDHFVDTWDVCNLARLGGSAQCIKLPGLGSAACSSSEKNLPERGGARGGSLRSTLSLVGLRRTAITAAAIRAFFD